MSLLLSILFIAVATWWAKSKLTREAIILFGGVLTAVGLIALILDWVNDIVTPIPIAKNEVGEWLYGMGPEISILGNWWGVFALALLWGVVLLFVGLTKKRQKAINPRSVPEPAQPTEEEMIRERLGKEVARMRRESSPGPDEAGKKDATREDGPIPKETDMDPPPGGYEHDARLRYEELGDGFLVETIKQMEQDIRSAMATLADIKNRILNRSYEAVALAKYQEKEQTLSPLQVKNKQEEYQQAHAKRKTFIESLKLDAAEDEDWSDKRTTRKSLLVWGGLFALIEFAVSYYFLEGEIGGQTAIWLSAVAVVIILVLASCAGWLPQFMRRNSKTHTRIISTVMFLAVFILAVMGIGLLLGYRGDTTIDLAVIGYGYNSLFDNLTNFVVFVVNAAAFGVVFWKVLLTFNKFHGFDKVDGNYIKAKSQWEAMYQKADDNISMAIKKADSKAVENKNAAEQAMAIINRKGDALARIKETISGAYKEILRGGYNEDIKRYRDANRANRALAVYPCPGYFDVAHVDICDVSKHFENVNDPGIFLQGEEKNLKQAKEDHDTILKRDQEWNNQKQPLRNRLGGDFKKKLNEVKLGAANVPAPMGVAGASDEPAETVSAPNS